MGSSTDVRALVVAQPRAHDTNIAVVHGTVHRLPQWRQLPSGQAITNIDVKVSNADKRREVVRVSWPDAPVAALEFDEGESVWVIGRIRTYWSGKRSETDLLASVVLRATSTAKVRRSLTDLMAALQTACP